MSQERTPQQEQAIKEVNDFLKAQTPTAKRTNKTYRGLQAGVNAAVAVTGQFAQYCSDQERSIATEFFAAYNEDGFTGIFNIATKWFD